MWLISPVAAPESCPKHQFSSSNGLWIVRIWFLTSLHAVRPIGIGPSVRMLFCRVYCCCRTSARLFPGSRLCEFPLRVTNRRHKFLEPLNLGTSITLMSFSNEDLWSDLMTFKHVSSWIALCYLESLGNQVSPPSTDLTNPVVAHGGWPSWGGGYLGFSLGTPPATQLNGPKWTRFRAENPQMTPLSDTKCPLTILEHFRRRLLIGAATPAEPRGEIFFCLWKFWVVKNFWNLLKSAGEIFLSGLRGAKNFSNTFRMTPLKVFRGQWHSP